MVDLQFDVIVDEGFAHAICDIDLADLDEVEVLGDFSLGGRWRNTLIRIIRFA